MSSRVEGHGPAPTNPPPRQGLNAESPAADLVANSDPQLTEIAEHLARGLRSGSLTIERSGRIDIPGGRYWVQVVERREDLVRLHVHDGGAEVLVGLAHADPFLPMLRAVIQTWRDASVSGLIEEARGW